MLPVLDKIESVFKRNNPFPTGTLCTLKLDGTCTLIHEGKVMMRRDMRLKNGEYVTGKKKPTRPPEGWISFVEPFHGAHHIGFRPIHAKQDKYVLEAIRGDEILVLTSLSQNDPPRVEWQPISKFEGVTCEFIGPKMNGNPHQLVDHAFYPHGSFTTEYNGPLTEDALREFVSDFPFSEGLVWHCPDKTLWKVHRGHLRLPWRGK
jgi:hypothetical protein